ncbi:MAG: hypothetical protein RJB38_1901 [Pseudomonadota bacterium]|jgi:hypothetical protein
MSLRPQPSGLLILPLALALGLAVMAAIGFFVISQRWTHQVAIQLRLDHCTGSSAVTFRNHLNSLEEKNRKIRALRLGVAAAEASANPALAESLRTTISILAKSQDLERGQWKKRQLEWWTASQCQTDSWRRSPLPEAKAHRAPPDPLGENPLDIHWPDPPHWRIRLTHQNRISESYVYRNRKTPTSEWTASWRAETPAALSGASLD